MPLVLLPWHRNDWFPQFRIRARIRVTPPIRQPPPAQSPSTRPARSRRWKRPWFWRQVSGLRRVIEGSLSFVSADPHLLEVRPRRFDPSAHHHGSLPQQPGVVWSPLSEADSGGPSSNSHAASTQSVSPFRTSFLCAPAAHSPSSSARSSHPTTSPPWPASKIGCCASKSTTRPPQLPSNGPSHADTSPPFCITSTRPMLVALLEPQTKNMSP